MYFFVKIRKHVFPHIMKNTFKSANTQKYLFSANPKTGSFSKTQKCIFLPKLKIKTGFLIRTQKEFFTKIQKYIFPLKPEYAFSPKIENSISDQNLENTFSRQNPKTYFPLTFQKRKNVFSRQNLKTHFLSKT